MEFVLSPSSHGYFYSSEPGSRETPTLINASINDIFSCWSESFEYQRFIKGVGGVERIVKYRYIEAWMERKDELWAPVIDTRTHNPRRIEVLDGRHTLFVLKAWGYRKIQIAVPMPRAGLLEYTLGGTAITELAV